MRVFEDVGATFFDIETDLLIVLDENGDIERVNPAFTRVLGYSESEVLRVQLLRLIPSNDWSAFLNAFTAPQPKAFRVMCKEQGEVTVRLVAVRFRAMRGFIVLRRVIA